MRIKKLEVIGFKSFLDKISFSFNVPITAVVGPNGCGKSNVVDAIKWVTGELSFKELRGRSMEDLIFAGSETRPPTSMMEVALTLDNSKGLAPVEYQDYSEIKVLRRIFRDGSSEFFINKVGCRLRDIIDLFLDTGIGESSYSIIEQGRVGTIVSGKADDRRLIIEEAAGITKYKHRKKAAERKMDYTRQNLLRVDDVLGELKRQVGSLERQARKAERFRKAREQARELDIALTAKQYLTLDQDQKSFEQQETSLSDDLSQQEAELIDQDQKLEQKRIALLELERSFEESQKTLFEKGAQVQTKENQIEHTEQEIQRLCKTAKEEQERTEHLKEKQIQLGSQRERLESELKAMKEEKETLQADLQKACEKEEHHQSQLQAQEQEIEKKKELLVQFIAQEAEIRNQATLHEKRVQEIVRELEERKREHGRALKEKADLDTQYAHRQKLLGAVVQLRLGLERDQAEAQSRLESLQSERQEKLERISKLREQLGGNRSRLKTLEEFIKSYQGYQKGARTIMKQSASPDIRLKNVRGLLGELIQASPGFERAVQAALSEFIECVIVDSAQDALDAVEFLRGERRGRGAFLPRKIQSRKQEQKLPQNSFIKGWLKDFVEIRDVCKASFDALFGDFVVLENLAQAIRLREQGVSLPMVTLQGDLLSREGIIMGGNWDSDPGILDTKKEVKELEKALQKIEHQLSVLEHRRTHIDLEIQATKAAVDQLSQDVEREGRKTQDHEKDFQRLEEALLHRKEAISVMEEEQSRLLGEKEKHLKIISEGREQEKEISTQKVSYEEMLQNLTQGLALQRETTSKCSKETTAIRVRQASLQERLESYTREVQSLSEQESTISHDITALIKSAETHDFKAKESQEKIQLLQTEREKMIQSYENQKQSNNKLRTQHDQSMSEIQVAEKNLRTIREEKEALQERLNEIRLQLREEVIKLDHLKEQIQERYAMDLIEVISNPEFVPLENEKMESTHAELEALRVKMTKIGDVNLAAIEELAELQERIQFMSGQKEDLEKSLNSLQSAIRKINLTTRQRFKQTFEVINEKFQEIFPRLFRGGKGFLVLLEPENLLETGVDIVAQPPGKKLQNMNLLSGGEKALTAIALLFAIFEYKAPPFCVLDEVDAPLDDANVLRFLSLVQKMSDQTQFILITHNKATMEVAQNLYGITMEEPGISRMVSVRVHQIVEEETPKTSVLPSSGLSRVSLST